MCVVAGEDVTVDMEKHVLINHTTGKEYALKPLGDVSAKPQILKGYILVHNSVTSGLHSCAWLSASFHTCLLACSAACSTSAAYSSHFTHKRASHTASYPPKAFPTVQELYVRLATGQTSFRNGIDLTCAVMPAVFADAGWTCD
jgi:hypothetical protein